MLEDESKKQLPTPNFHLRSHSFLQTLFFTWIGPLLAYGSRVPLSQESIPELADG